MTDLTLQFCSFDSTMGKLIPWFTQGEVGHVDVLTPDGKLLLGSQHENLLGDKPAGVQFRPLNYGDSCGMIGKVRVALSLTAEQHDKAWTFLRAQVGKPYDTIGIVGFVIGRNWRDDQSWFCSELVAAALEASGFFPRTLVTPPNKITPATLLTVCSAFAEVVPA